MAQPIYEVLKLLHILTVVFMSAPLYNLIVVGERVRFGKASLQVDKYFENILRSNSTRCYVFQLTALATGIILVVAGGFPVSLLYTNWVLLSKGILLLILLALLSTVHLHIQPSIDRLLAQASDDTIPQELAQPIGRLRTFRKRLAAVCLFLVITTIILALQVFSPFTPPLTLLLIGLAGLFSWRVYKRAVPYGWI